MPLFELRSTPPGTAELEATMTSRPTADTPADPPHNNYNLTWGAWQQRGDWYTGAFDDTAYFKRALTGDEIKAFFDSMMAKAQ